MQKFHAGLVSVTFRHLAPGDVAALARRAGLAAIEWGADVHVPPGDAANAGAVAELTRNAGLTVAAYGSYLRMPTSTEAEVDSVMDTAVQLGAPMVRIWPGERGRASHTYTPAERADVARAIDKAAASAAKHGLSLGLEYHPDTLTDNQASSAALMADITAPNVYLYWQPSPGIDEAAALDELDALGRHVAHLHVFAWDGAKARYPLQTAHSQWQRYIAAVPQGRWTGPRYAMLEFVAGDDPGAFLEDAETLKKMLNG
ncbi:TIM barrel protein [Acuticoccus sp. MNP-M23]|uniref:sugar phosphate isomerase/epimerase family protein n=1 Tax=Acuticoccus sp. MNP-M23 TaxID=3072793 RepID=UPI002815A56E|nr:TIM barrel protein [Acuticoccus sp. MNP-M23]WMS44564.1 TIM barrel protein [Acuticoccus sp. MNP-M23]